jgi:hypothetical protein
MGREIYPRPAGGKADLHFAPCLRDRWVMSNHIYKKVELVGSSPDSIEDAVQNAIAKASKTLRNLRWFEVVETRGQIEDGRVAHWQVTIKVGFTLEA